jgi:hypothetical protein
VAASAPDGSDAATNIIDLVRTLCDAKNLACGDAYTPFSAAHPNDRETFPFKNARRRRPSSTLLRPTILISSSTTRIVAKWGRLKPSS